MLYQELTVFGKKKPTEVKTSMRNKDSPDTWISRNLAPLSHSSRNKEKIPPTAAISRIISGHSYSTKLSPPNLHRHTAAAVIRSLVRVSTLSSLHFPILSCVIPLARVFPAKDSAHSHSPSRQLQGQRGDSYRSDSLCWRKGNLRKGTGKGGEINWINCQGN